jgi:hypothetical protein
MVKFSSRKDAITMIKIRAANEAVVFLIEEQLKDAEAEILGCNPQDLNMRDKLVKAQTLRNLLTTLSHDLK